MSIIIQKIEKFYVLHINKTYICDFVHEEKIIGLSQCLRDAADAIDNLPEERSISAEYYYKNFVKGK